MAAPYPTKTDLENKLGAAQVLLYAKAAGDTAIEDSCAQAWSSFVSAARVKYTSDSIAALTASSLPDVAKRHILADTIALLASASNHPDYLDTAASAAKEWRAIVAAGKEYELDSVLNRITTSTGGSDVRISAPRSILTDFRDTSSAISRHDPDLG